MDPNPYQPPEALHDSPLAKDKPQSGGWWIAAAFMGGVAGAWLVTGAIYMQAIEGVELHPDGAFMGAVCLLCPLVGLLAALVTWRLTRRHNSG